MALRHQLACQRQLVERRRAGKDGSVGWNTIARPNDHDRADRDLLDRRFNHAVFGFELCRLRRNGRERLDPGASPAGRDAFEKFADGEEEDDDGSFLGCANQDGTDDRDGHQHFDGEDRPVAQRPKGVEGHRHARDETRGEIDEIAYRRKDIGGDKRCPDQRARRDDEATPIALPPRSVDRGAVVIVMVDASSTRAALRLRPRGSFRFGRRAGGAAS